MAYFNQAQWERLAMIAAQYRHAAGRFDDVPPSAYRNVMQQKEQGIRDSRGLEERGNEVKPKMYRDCNNCRNEPPKHDQCKDIDCDCCHGNQ